MLAFATRHARRAAHVSTGDRLFDKVLVANRGEIACRVFQTCQRLGIKTVAVYSEADALAKHVRMADEAVCIGPAPSSQSYLDMDAILDAVAQTGAEGVHPGYGFLSENAKFVHELDKAGVSFVGPNASSIELMGDKIESKRVALEAGVSTVPGFVGECKDEKHLLEISNDIGYPVMIKASAGGGGKGMRIARNDEEAVEGFRMSMDEAEKAFGDRRMLVEKFIQHPRHIEIQVLGDKKGNLIYLPERECSIQRRNQKVIEESPSPFLDPETRRAMGEQAVALAKAVGYDSAGTCEMMVDANKDFYFLEMNTRLQVEHPITECVTGVDLVEQMLRSAAGQEISVTQADTAEPKGWAIECRVYAEDPFRNYLPSIGTLRTYVEPVGEDRPEVRCDSGVYEGSEISMFYDPMISKLVTYGPDRDQALQSMRDALDDYVITGLRHNVALCRAVVDHPGFVAGETHTDFLDIEYKDGFQGYPMTDEHWDRLARITAALRFAQDHRGAGEFAEAQIEGMLARGAAQGLGGFSADDLEVPSDTYKVVLPGRDHVTEAITVHIGATGRGSFRTEVEGGAQVELDLDEITGPLRSAVFSAIPETDAEDPAASNPEDDVAEDWHSESVQVLEQSPNKFTVQMCGTAHDVRVHSVLEHSLAGNQTWERVVDLSKAIPSPMPGAVVEIDVKVGDEVYPGQVVCILEAMKMMNVIKAEAKAVVKEINVKPGDHVGVDDILISFE